MKNRFLAFYLTMTIFSIFAFGNQNVLYAVSTKAYIPNYNSHDVSVIDLDSDTVIATIPVGNNPFGVAVSEIKNRVYVTNAHDKTISVIDAALETVVDTIPVDNTPTGIAVNPAGTRVYAGYNRIDGASLAVIDTSNNTIINKIHVGKNPWGIDVNSTGTRVYVVNRYEDTNTSYGSVKVIDTTNDSVVASIPI